MPEENQREQCPAEDEAETAQEQEQVVQDQVRTWRRSAFVTPYSIISRAPRHQSYLQFDTATFAQQSRIFDALRRIGVELLSERRKVRGGFSVQYRLPKAIGDAEQDIGGQK